MRYKLHRAKSPHASNYLYLISDNDMVGEYWFSLDKLASNIWKFCDFGIEYTYIGSSENYLGVVYECETKKEMEEHIEDLVLIEELKR